MTTYDTYGTSAYTATELAHLVADRLGLTFLEHDSYYRGVYLVADTAPHHVEIQPNAIPGDDGQDDLYDDEHPTFRRCSSSAARTATPRSPAASTRSMLSLSCARRPLDRRLNPRLLTIALGTRWDIEAVGSTSHVRRSH